MAAGILMKIDELYQVLNVIELNHAPKGLILKIKEGSEEKRKIVNPDLLEFIPVVYSYQPSQRGFKGTPYIADLNLELINPDGSVPPSNDAKWEYADFMYTLVNGKYKGFRLCYFDYHTLKLLLEESILMNNKKS